MAAPQPEPFAYPDAPHSRRHGPRGYSNLESYRPWLRDEFTFRCVYCLARERWHKGRYGFQVDHVIPKSRAPSLALDYENLAYACATCNEMKSGAGGICGPCQAAYAECLRVSKRSSKNNSHFSPAATYHGYERICVKTRSCFWTTAKDGTIAALNREGEFLIRVLRLDNAENTEYRRLILEVTRLASGKHGAMYCDLMGFPDQMPDLARRRPPGGNLRPEGVRESWHARRARNELPETY